MGVMLPRSIHLAFYVGRHWVCSLVKITHDYLGIRHVKADLAKSLYLVSLTTYIPILYKQ